MPLILLSRRKNAGISRSYRVRFFPTSPNRELFVMVRVCLQSHRSFFRYLPVCPAARAWGHYRLVLDVGRREYGRGAHSREAIGDRGNAVRANRPNKERTEQTNKPIKMKHIKTSSSILLALGLLPLSAAAGTFSFTPLTLSVGRGDSDTGIDPSKIYTHLVDFGADPTAATINGVQFTQKGATGPNYTLVYGGGNFRNNSNGNFKDGLGDLFSDFFFAGITEGERGGIQRLTLTGLREAHTYRLSLIVAAWGSPAQDWYVSDAPAGSPIPRIARNGSQWTEDNNNPLEPTGAGDAALINYEYVAPADGTLVITMDSVSDGDTFHFYGFFNEQIALPKDTDGDGMPDVYEEANGLNKNVNDANGDLDNDGLKNIDEYKAGTKANNPDTDGDGLKDGVETNTKTWVSASNTGTDPLNPDTDGDGLKDGVETNTGTFVGANNTGSNPFKADTDGDGFADGVEAQQGFNPNSAANTPESEMSIRTAVEFRFNAASGQRYRIEGSADLKTWSTIEENIAGTGARVTRFYSIENTPIRFYRWVRQ